MEFKKLMRNLIEEEIANIEREGKKVKLKTLRKKRIKYTLIFGLIFLLMLASGLVPVAFIDLVVYFIFMYNANNVSVITKLAKKSPDTPISEIVKGDMR